MDLSSYTAIVTFLLFTGGVGLITWRLARHDNLRSNEGFFLAGRSLSFPLIAASLLLTNLSTEQLVGLNGDAFSYGLNVMAWEVVAVVALVAMALFFLPRFLKSGITTVPEYLALRFDRRTGSIANLIFLIAYVAILLPMVLYTGAKGLISILDLKLLLGIQHEMQLLYLLVITIGGAGALYALFGGLRTIAISDLLNGIGLLIGGFMIVCFALHYIGGSDGGILTGLSKIKSFEPELFNSVSAEKGVPLTTLFSGVLFINIFYWCTNQQIIQRTLGASSLAEGQKGILLTGLLKLLGPLYLVLPGLAAYYLYKNADVEFLRIVQPAGAASPDSTLAYGALVRTVMPTVLTGFFAAVMVGAVLSSYNSALNSTCTLFSLGFYREYIRPAASDIQVIRSGKWFGWIITAISILIAPLLNQVESIFSYLQKMNGIYFIPLLAVVLVGMLSRRVPAAAAKWALGGGTLLIAFCYFVPPFDLIVTAFNEYHFLGIVFLYLMLFMFFWGEIDPLRDEFRQIDAKAVNLTPWRHAGLAGTVLLLLVVLIYVYFADLSVLRQAIK